MKDLQNNFCATVNAFPNLGICREFKNCRQGMWIGKEDIDKCDHTAQFFLGLPSLSVVKISGFLNR